MLRERLAFMMICAAVTIANAAERYHLGRAVTPEELVGWNIDVRPDGAGLPPGYGSVREGQRIYAATCAACHGANGRASRWIASSAAWYAQRPRRFRPWAAIGLRNPLFGYIRRAMPFNAPQSLTTYQVYAVAAYVLYLNKIVPEYAGLDAKTLAKVQMPNRNGFTSPDPRPDIKTEPCMTDCR
jgi:cytochrome c